METRKKLVEIALKLFGSMISFASGLSLGRAGPSMHVGMLVGLFFHKYFSKLSKYRRYLLVSGACAGMTATFSAPFTGIAFSFEELGEQKNHIVFVCIVFSSIAYVDFVPDYEGFNYTDEWRLLPLSEWRKVDSQLKDWIWKTYTGTKLPELFLYEEGHHRDEIDDISPGVILNTFFAACYQDMYTLAFSYDEETIEQEIEVLPKREEKYANNYKFFPPLMLCHPLNETSQKYLCSDNMYTRSCINVEHPFMIWLLENAEILNNSFSRQFRQIIEMLRFGDEFEDDEIINVVNNIREQLLFQLNQHKIDMSKCPELSESDFYYTEI